MHKTKVVNFWLSISLLFVVKTINAQTILSGKITDTKGNPVAGANVVIKDSYDGASTDGSGNFKFTTTDSGLVTVVASMIGFNNDEKRTTLHGGEAFITFILKEKNNELNTVTITAGAFEASDEKKMVILRPLDIVTTAGSNGDIYGALQTLPGTQPTQDQEGLFVRGGDAAEAKTLIDGMEVANPYFSSVPEVPQRGRFSPFLFKGTNFSTGGYSAQYGQAMSSVLVLESEDLPPRTMSNIALMTVGGGGGYTKRWKNTSLGGFANYFNLSPYFALVKQNRDWNSPPQSFSGSVIFRQKTSETGMLKAFVNYQYSDLALNFNDLNDVTGNSKNHLGLNNYNIFSTLSYKEILDKKWTVNVAGSYSKDLVRLHPTPESLVFSNRLTQAKGTIARSLGELTTIRAGAEAKYNSFSNLYNTSRIDSTDLFTAAFLEGDIYITRKLVARTGLRLENSYLLRATNLAPRISVAYRVGKYDQVSFAYGDFYQTPDKNYLIYTNLNKFEKATHYIANFQHVDDKRTFRVEGYYKKYENLVRTESPTYSPYASGVAKDSDGKGYAKGVDIFWRDKKTFKYTDYWISYSYLDTKREYLYYPVQLMPTFAAKHVLNVVWKRWFPKLNCSIGFTYAYASGRPYYNPNKTELNTILSDRTKDYHNLSLTASYLTTIKKHFTVFSLSVGNVPGIDNVFSYRYSYDGMRRAAVGPTSKRSFFLGMFISIGEDKTE
jgi:hypothetical protein